MRGVTCRHPNWCLARGISLLAIWELEYYLVRDRGLDLDVEVVLWCNDPLRIPIWAHVTSGEWSMRSTDEWDTEGMAMHTVKMSA